MRDTSRFAELVESSTGPVTVTKNGYSKFVVMRSEDYDRLETELARARLMGRIALAERERNDGLTKDAFESLASIEEKYGLCRQDSPDGRARSRGHHRASQRIQPAARPLFRRGL